MLRIHRAIPSAQIRLIVFDLDGTLIDSRRDLCEAVNAMLRTFDRPELPENEIASYIGDGAGMLVQRALGADGADPAMTARALESFLDYYRVHKLDHTYVYSGVMEAIDALRIGPINEQRQMAVLTNKPVNPSREICSALGLSHHFFSIYGGNSFATKKPDPAGLQVLIAEAGVRPEETLMVGDSEVDIHTARAAGTWSLGCRFGLSPHTIADMELQSLVDAAVDTPLEWVEALGQQNAVQVEG